MAMGINMNNQEQPELAAKRFMRDQNIAQRPEVRSSAYQANVNGSEVTLQSSGLNPRKKEAVGKEDVDNVSIFERPPDKLHERNTPPDQLNEAVTRLNNSIQNVQRNLEFSMDDKSGRVVIKVTDKETDEVVRQIPSDEVLALAQQLQEMVESKKSRENQGYTGMEGMLLKTRA
jgi:uncharacterized FlaG/YvyC family protein